MKTTPHQVKIARLQLSQWSAFYLLFKTIVLKEFHYPQAYLEAKTDENRLKKTFVAKYRFFWIATAGEEVIGFLIAIKQSDGVSFINWVGVDSGYRGQGIGRLLVKNWQNWAKKHNCHKLRVSTTLLSNIPFYKNLGFHQEGKMVNDSYGLDRFIFGKVLRPFNH